MKEVWMQITDYEGLYYISNFGRVKDNKERIRGTYINNKGYECITLRFRKNKYHHLIHRLVAEYFIPKVTNCIQVNHIDCNKLNNRVDNLEWTNQRDNYNHGMKHFLYSKNEDHYFSKLSNKDVEMMNALYKLGFIRATVAKIFNVNPSSLEAIEKGISFRELGLDWNIKRQKYKDLPNIVLPCDIRDYFKDNTVLNILIAQGKVSV